MSINVLRAILLDDLPASVMTKELFATFYGCTAWRDDVKSEIIASELEVARFIKLRDHRGIDRVAEATALKDAHDRLNAFMEEHRLDAIFVDAEEVSE